MKKTLTVNLGGTVFNIDDDAYRLLDNYLSNLKMHFRKEVGADEIVDDIERRISELFAEKLSAGSQVITIADVEEVIARMGKPEDMEAEGESASADSSVGTAGRGGFAGLSGLFAFHGQTILPLWPFVQPSSAGRAYPHAHTGYTRHRRVGVLEHR